MEQLLLDLVSKFPLASSILLGIGVLRVINKPLFSLFHAYVDATPSAKDNEVLASVEGSRIYKGITYALDWAASVKLPAKK
jgi:hypothetical protein